jgi:hypothetical protein
MIYTIVSARWLGDTDVLVQTQDAGDVVVNASDRPELWGHLQSSGVTIAPFAPPAVGVNDYVAAIEAHVDATARAKAYGGTASLASYVNSSVPAWAAEAAAFVAWRDAVWVYAYGEMAKVQAAQRTQPTVAELIAELPTITWPA